ncbi:MAG: very short patch repair endonuclease [Bacteroidia bacterium 44-10]|nr:MAG: very short patch repair endonuclease [Bacteroidia bacterium 44-10]
MDIWDKKKRSSVMAKIKGRDTKPEWIVRRYLYSRGYRYRKNVKGLPGTPDIVLRKYGIVIFIHGCFWHGHILDGHIPQSNTDFWRKKIEKNQLRDGQNKKKLLAMGWAVITIWECQLKPTVRKQTLSELEYYIHKHYLDRHGLRQSYYLGDKEEDRFVAEEQEEYKKRPNKINPSDEHNENKP